jgi:hypothetical protein
MNTGKVNSPKWTDKKAVFIEASKTDVRTYCIYIYLRSQLVVFLQEQESEGKKGGGEILLR